jgi:endonuclease/exonuclease/phosphatase family metal-dependent hydrolase
MRVVLVILSIGLVNVPPAQAAEQPLTVMSRNLYLGADVGVALELIPDFPAAAQFMWNQVAATDFSLRAPALAREVIAANADVVGLQEATNWYCKKNLWSKKVVVFNFTEQFLAATKASGVEYVLARKSGRIALNIGYSIPAIPYLTMVSDPKTFQPLFGSDRAACGFEIGDAIAVKKELAPKILQVGNTEYDASYSIVPKLMTIYRGYTWIDLEHNGSKVRIISTHLESLWDSNKVPNAALQAQQLISDTAQTKMPLIVIGDFNSDPRDPRPDVKSNPGGQPESSKECPAQVTNPTIDGAIVTCNAYWIMRKAGFIEVGPDAANPKNFTWGMNALLTGPDEKRLKAAQAMGNQAGFTDRLDYIFLKNGTVAVSAALVGTEPYKEGAYSTDHAGVVAGINLPSNTEVSPPLDAHAPFPISFWNWVGIGALALIIIILKWRRGRKLRA